MMEIKLNSGQEYVGTSNPVKIQSGKKYGVITEVQGFEGEEFCGYFCVIISNKNKKEFGRKIQWLNDFSGNKKTVEIIFEAPLGTESIQACYRINNETPVNSKCSFKLLDPNQVNISEVDINTPDNFDFPGNFTLPKAKELTIEEEDVLEKNLVWLFSYARSGTSWLAGQLLSYNTKFMNEPLIGMHLGTLAPFMLSEKVIRNNDLFKNEPNYFFSTAYKNTWKFYLRKLVLNRIFAQFNDLNHKIIIKEPNGSFAADILAECFPNSKIIILIRDGRDMIDSKIDSLQKAAWGTRDGIFSLPKQKRLEFVKFHSKSWVKQIEILKQTFDSHSKELRYLLQYENLLKDTHKITRDLYKFIDVEASENELRKVVDKFSFKNISSDSKGKGKVVRSASPGKWKENMSNDEQKLMNSIMHDTLKEFDYIV